MIYPKRTGQVQPRENMWKPSLCPVYSSSRRQLATEILKYCHKRKMCHFGHFLPGFLPKPFMQLSLFRQNHCSDLISVFLQYSLSSILPSALKAFALRSPWHLWDEDYSVLMSHSLSQYQVKEGCRASCQRWADTLKAFSFKKRVELIFFILEKEFLEAKVVCLHCERDEWLFISKESAALYWWACGLTFKKQFSSSYIFIHPKGCLPFSCSWVRAVLTLLPLPLFKRNAWL